jgi:hypothetical protein
MANAKVIGPDPAALPKGITLRIPVHVGRWLAAWKAHEAAVFKAAAPAPDPAPAAPAPAPAPAQLTARVLSAAQIGQLWLSAGGSAGTEQTAICIAEHESSGNTQAVSPSDDFGVWQIHADPAALNPMVNAKTAVQMSDDGTNWSAWTTAGDCGV